MMASIYITYQLSNQYTTLRCANLENEFNVSWHGTIESNLTTLLSLNSLQLFPDRLVLVLLFQFVVLIGNRLTTLFFVSAIA